MSAPKGRSIPIAERLMKPDPHIHEQMMLDAEQLAGLAVDPRSRTEHLIAAGKHHLLARQAGGGASPETHH
jgi:hypothetical protein